MAYSSGGDIIALDNPKAGAMVMSTSLENYSPTSTDPIRMFARRDAFRTVAEAKASGQALVPLDLYERLPDDGRRRLAPVDDAVAAALESPAPGLTPFRWIEALALDRILHDRWAFLILPQEDGSVQFIRLPGKWISFGTDQLRRIVEVRVHRSNGNHMPIPIEQVAFDVGYDPSPGGDSTRGYPVSTTLESAAMELDKGAAYRDALLSNGPKVPMYYSRPLEAPDWQKSGARDRWIEKMRAYSAERAGEAPLLEDGMEIKAAPQLAAGDVDYQSTRREAQIEFAIAMHFPPELIGYRTGNFSNMESLKERLYEALSGDIIAFRQALNGGLRRAGLLSATRYVEENLGIRLASAPEKQASLLQTQVGAPVRTVNEARRMLNLPVVEGGDDLIVPLNVTKGGLASPTDTAPDPSLLALPGSPRQKALPAGRGGEPVFKAAAQKQVERFAGDLLKALERQAGRVAKVLGSDSSPGPLGEAFDLERENAELASVIYPHAYALAQTGAAAVLSRYNPEEEGFDPEVLLPWLLKASAGQAQEMNSGTLAKLSESVQSEDWHAATVAALALVAGAAHASVWAQTIGTTATSFGSQDAAKVSGLNQKTWRHNSGKNGRSAHAALNGQTVEASALFTNGMRWPGDPTGGADDNANCHCTLEWSHSDS